MSVNAIQVTPVSYDFAGASAATGLSVDVLDRARKAGELEVRYVTVAGRTIAKPVIERDELARFVGAGKPERSRDDS